MTGFKHHTQRPSSPSFSRSRGLRLLPPARAVAGLQPAGPHPRASRADHPGAHRHPAHPRQKNHHSPQELHKRQNPLRQPVRHANHPHGSRSAHLLDAAKPGREGRAASRGPASSAATGAAISARRAGHQPGRRQGAAATGSGPGPDPHPGRPRPVANRSRSCRRPAHCAHALRHPHPGRPRPFANPAPGHHPGHHPAAATTAIEKSLDKETARLDPGGPFALLLSSRSEAEQSTVQLPPKRAVSSQQAELRRPALPQPPPEPLPPPEQPSSPRAAVAARPSSKEPESHAASSLPSSA